VPLSLSLTREKLYRGPNPISSRPLLVLHLRLESSPGRPELHDLTERLRLQFPLLKLTPVPCETATAPELLARAALNWTLAFLNLSRGLLKEHGLRPEGDAGAVLWMEYHHADLSLNALTIALELLCRMHDSGPSFQLDQALSSRMDALQRACVQLHPDFIAAILIAGAGRLGLPWMRDPQGAHCWRFGQGASALSSVETFSDTASYTAQSIVADKRLTHDFLGQLGLPCTQQYRVSSRQEAREVAAKLGWPVVLKPSNRGQGKGVTAGIVSADMLDLAFDSARKFAGQGLVLLEKHIEGDDHRLMVLRGKLTFATRRRASRVRGDGRSSLRSLVEAINRVRYDEKSQESFLKPILLDEPALLHLQAQGLSPESVPEAGREISMRSNANVTTGGTAEDMLAQVHPEIRRLAEVIAANLRMDCLGIDYLTTDVSRPWTETKGVVIELNSTPGIDVHMAPGCGPEQVGAVILEGRAGRIPTLLLIANEADLSRREADWLPQLAEAASLGYAAPSGARLGACALQLTDNSLQEQVESLLGNKACRRLVVSLTPELLRQNGLPLDHFDRILLAPETDLEAEWWDVLARHSGELASLPRVLSLDSP
jgi:cyanophycin synthetase